MNEKVKAAGEKVKGFFGKLGKKTLIILGAALAAILLIAVIVTVVLNNKPYTVLFTGLTGQEASSIMTYLEENGAIDYRLENNDTILVPQGQEAALKAKLLMEGYPKSGYSYDTYFEKVGALSTESERSKAFLVALQERMEAVIRCLDGVKDASVTIVQGEDRRYVLDDSNMVAATASVMVTMATGQKLSNQQVAAIRNLVAHGVQGLDIKNVSISDSMGNFYSAADENGVSADASQLKLQLEEQVNNSVRTNIMQVLIPLYGAENVSVGVSSTVDVSRVVGDSVTYTEPEGWPTDGSTGGKGIIGSRIYENTIIRDGDGAVGGVAGTETNSDIGEYVENYRPDGNESTIGASGQIDYKVNESRQQVVRTAGVVSDVMVSVSINTTTAGAVNVGTLLPHVARAAGIEDAVSAEKISILPQPFYVEPVPPIIPVDTLPDWVVLAAAIGGLVFLLLLVLILLIRRRQKKKKMEKLMAEQEAAGYFVPPETVAPPTAGADVMSIQTEKSMELRKDIRQFADENPEIAAQMVKSWLKGGEDSG